MKIGWQSSIGAATTAVASGCLVLLASSGTSLGAGVPAAIARRSARSAIVLAQADENVPPAQLNKYIAVYKAMQHNHTLTVEQAAAAQGLTLRQFRDVERRVESNDVARQTARRALAQSAAQSTRKLKQKQQP